MMREMLNGAKGSLVAQERRLNRKMIVRRLFVFAQDFFRNCA
jgi:hypothetical protein